MDISPVAAIGLARVAVHTLRDIAALPKTLFSGRANPSKSTGSAFSSDAPRASVAPASSTAGLGQVAAIDTAGLMATLAAQSQAKVAALATELGNLFSQHGIDTSLEVVLQTDAQGQVVVANDHPDKARIEALLARDPALTARFTQLGAAVEALCAARLASPQTGALASPTANGATSFRLALSNGTWRTSFAPA